MPEEKVVTQKEWLEEGKRLFGSDHMKWRYKCPVCGHIQTMQDFEEKGFPRHSAYTECIGRYIPGSQTRYLASPRDARVGPCDYAAYGLLRFGRKVSYDNPLDNPSHVVVDVFPFADVVQPLHTEGGNFE